MQTKHKKISIFMKIFFILFILFSLFSSEVDACVFPYPAINHATKECGYYYAQCTTGNGDIFKTTLPNNWEIVDKTTTNFNEHCKSIGYTIIEKDVPYQQVCCTWKVFVCIGVFILLLISSLFLFLTKKKRKK